ncbi:MAG: N-acetylneuraminate synthase [Flavobacteriales bacterium]|nr:N-acetylneuraminate synthase [Flavobacteriales bacterium]
MRSKVQIIAEAGVNHNGDISKAIEMIKIAAECGADFIKFQTFNADLLANPKAKKANYQISRTDKNESQLEMLKKLELNKSDHIKLIKECSHRNIKFLSAPFDIASIELLAELNLECIKIPSGEITNLPYLKKIGRLKWKIIISTGMATIHEIQNAVNILIDAGTPLHSISILHCSSQYPTVFNNVNLLAIRDLQDAFQTQIGLSDHAIGIETSIAAIALGASIIEKHFTLDKSLTGPDHHFSLNPSELSELVSKIRNVEMALGSGVKEPNEAELEIASVVRKSIHIKTDLNKGTVISEEMLIMQRPGTGISPMEIDYIVGKTIVKDKKRHDILVYSDFK